MSLPLSRQSILIGLALFLLVAVLGYQFLSHGSSITIREKKVPLSKILALLKKKGGIPVHSNIDPNTLVSLDVVEVPLAEAMEVLSIELDARWMPYFAMAPDKGKLAQVLGALETGSGREGLKTFYRPLPGPMEWVAGDYLPDLKNLSWVKEAVVGKNDLGGVLEAMAEGSEAGYAIPNDWNPSLAKLPTKDLLTKAVSQVTDESKGQEYSFLYLYQRPQNPNPQGGPGGAGGRPQFGGGGGGNRPPQNEEVTQKRLNLRMANLPPEERTAAQKALEEQKKQWDEMQKLSPEERRAKMQQMMDDPAVQEKMEEIAAKRDSRSSPEKRRERYKNYADRKHQAKGAK
jgi:hypothetical protein